MLGDDNSRCETTFDIADSAVYAQFTNLYAASGTLAGQTLVTDDSRTIQTSWDLSGIADRAVHQNVTGAGWLLVTETVLADDGSFAVTLGDGAAPMVLAASGGTLELIPLCEIGIGEIPVLDLPAGSSVRWLANGLALAEAPGAALLLVGAALLATNSSAGGPATTDLGGGVRLRFLDDGQLGVLERQDADGNWVTLDGGGVSYTAAGTLAIDADALRDAVGEDALDDILANPGYGEGFVVSVPAAVINVIVPTPVPAHEVLDVPELHIPTHTGGAPVVVNVGPFITPIPDGSMDGYAAIYATSVKELQQGTQGWQTTTTPTTWGELTSREPWLAKVEANWDAAIAQAGGMIDGETPQAYGQRAHGIFAEINGNDPVLLAAGVEAEVTVRTDGVSGYFGRPAGSQVLDVQLIKDQTLYYVHGKTGRGVIANSCLRDLADKVKERATTIVAITVK